MRSSFTDVIDIWFHVASELAMQAPLHCSLISHASIFQPKGHRDIAVGSERCYERHLDAIGLSQADLVVSRVSIKEAQELRPGCKVYNLINAWSSERIFGACFVEVRVIHAHAPLSVLLLHQN